MPDGPTIQRMFAEVAPGYDRANRVLSLGVDRRWRKRAVRMVNPLPGESGLDVCAGTGDLSLALARTGAAICGADFCAPMLVHAKRKALALATARPEFLAADTLQLPFASARFDFATVAFGIRNVSDPLAALREMARVVRPGGRIVVLEFCKPRLPLLGACYRFYFGKVLPTLGAWVNGAGQGAYRYLHDSVMQFAEREEFVGLLQRAGLEQARYELLTGGIAALYCGRVPR